MKGLRCIERIDIHKLNLIGYGRFRRIRVEKATYLDVSERIWIALSGVDWVWADLAGFGWIWVPIRADF